MDTVLAGVPGWAEMTVAALLASIWQGVVIVAGVALFFRLIPGLGAAVRSGIWLAVFVLVGMLDMVVPSSAVAARTVARGGLQVDARLGLAIAGAWAVLSVVRLARLAWGAGQLWGVARRATQLAMGGEGEPPVYLSREVARPGVVGFLAPRILLPLGLYEQLTADELEVILLHEREHLRRRDDWTNLLQRVALALMPLNPVLAWVDRRVCRERELACDDHVLRVTGARKAYASCLARLAETALVRRTFDLALGLAGGRSELARRVRRILDTPEKLLGRRAGNGVATTLMLGLLAGALALARCPRLVSFGSPAAMVANSLQTVGPKIPRVRGPERARMVEAVAPVNGTPTISAFRRASSVKRSGVRASRRSPQSDRQAWLVLTAWTAQSTPERLLVPVQFVVSTEPAEGETSSYAALPIGRSWLVLQL